MAEKNEQGEERLYAGMTRRTLCLGIGGAAVALGLGTLKLVSPQAIIRPPGGQDEDHLLASCIRCEKCVEVCPRHVIVPTHLEDGLIAVRTPTLNFKNNYCTWCEEENGGVPLCAQVCPTEALNPRVGSTPKNTVIGIATINTDWCLAYRFKGCSFCINACPYKAITTDKNGMPVVNEKLCNGCGACYTVCVSLSEGSILSGMTDRAIVVKPVAQ